MASFDLLADELARMGEAVRAMADSGLRKELTSAIRKAAEPVPQAVRRGLKPHLPDRYAATLDEDLRISISVRTGADAGVTIQAQGIAKKRKLGHLNTGVLSHPLFGDRRHWYRQPVTPGFFSGPVQDAAPRVREEIEKALERVAAIIWERTHG